MALQYGAGFLGIKTPEFGISERLSDMLGGQRNAQGGSNLFGSNTSTQAYSPQVLGSSTENLMTPSQNYSPTPNYTPAGPVAPSAPRQSAPQQQSGGAPNFDSIYNSQYQGWDRAAAMADWNAKGQPTSFGGGGGGEDINGAIDSIYGESMNYLNQAEGSLKSALPSYMQDAENLYNAGKSTLDSGKSSTMNQIQQNVDSAGNLKEDALNSARRLFNELSRSGQQRFGGASSASQAYSELNNQEQQRRSGEIYKQHQNTIQQLESKKVDVESQYQNSLLQLTTQKENAVSQANRDFQNKLLEINRMRAEAGQNKAQMRLDALQNLRNQMFQIQQQQVQFQQQLEAQRQSSLSEIGKAQQSFSGAGMGAQQSFDAFSSAGLNNPTTGLQVSQGGSTTFGGAQPMTGSIRRPDEQYTGSVTSDPYIRDQFGQPIGTRAR